MRTAGQALLQGGSLVTARRSQTNVEALSAEGSLVVRYSSFSPPHGVPFQRNMPVKFSFQYGAKALGMKEFLKCSKGR